MDNKKVIRISIFSLIVAILATVGGFGFFVANFIFTFFAIFIAIVISEVYADYFSEKGKKNAIFFGALILLFNFYMIFFGDSKDAFVLSGMQVAWILLALLLYIFKKIVKEDVNLFVELSQWYILFIMVVISTKIGDMIKVYADFFHLLMAVLAWRWFKAVWRFMKKP